MSRFLSEMTCPNPLTQSVGFGYNVFWLTVPFQSDIRLRLIVAAAAAISVLIGRIGRHEASSASACPTSCNAAINPGKKNPELLGFMLTECPCSTRPPVQQSQTKSEGRGGSSVKDICVSPPRALHHVSSHSGFANCLRNTSDGR